jgi:hypothetical protein
VHDLVDNVTLEAEHAGKSAAKYIKEGPYRSEKTRQAVITAGYGIKYVLPQQLDLDDLSYPLSLSFRVMRPSTDAMLVLESKGQTLHTTKYQHLLPGEMGMLKLTSAIINDIENSTEITVRLAREGE